MSSVHPSGPQAPVPPPISASLAGRFDPASPNRPTLRRRILGVVGALVILSLLGSSASLYRITEVSRSLDAINRVSVPVSRLLLQIQSDGDVFKRELERRLGENHWKDSHWRPRPVPRWIEEVLSSEFERLQTLIQDTAAPKWSQWMESTGSRFRELMRDADLLYTTLEKRDLAQASQIYQRLQVGTDEWRGQLEWAVNEHDRVVRQAFSHADSKVAALRMGLEAILVVVVSLSLLLLWLGERALRPLDELTRLARQIARRGLRKEDKAFLPEIALNRQDEVSSLAREFHAMATALLEREKIVETQKARLQEQNRLLREMGALNENVLKSIRSILIVVDSEGRITQSNPLAESWLGADSRRILGTGLRSWEPLRAALGESMTQLQAPGQEPIRLERTRIQGRDYGGNLIPLRGESGQSGGWIVDLVDITEDLELQDRLQRAENLAVVGRMSAQVAHEIRNPLHSIGLEADLALEMAGSPALKQSLQAILASVDRLEKITENYLKLSRLSAGQKSITDLGAVLEAVLATYASQCESLGIQVDWERSPAADLRVYGDADLLEQMLGNLLRNAMQAIENSDPQSPRKIHWKLGALESGRVWLRVEDSGPGIAPEIRSKLFTPFVTTRAQGTGLGLSFVKKVVEEHGGQIETADRPGVRGACFDILMPSFLSLQAEKARATLTPEIEVTS